MGRNKKEETGRCIRKNRNKLSECCYENGIADISLNLPLIFKKKEKVGDEVNLTRRRRRR